MPPTITITPAQLAIIETGIFETKERQNKHITRMKQEPENYAGSPVDLEAIYTKNIQDCIELLAKLKVFKSNGEITLKLES
jgi:hypothetical protein